MADRQGLLLTLIRKYESATREERLAMTAVVLDKCRESDAPVPSRLKRVYVKGEEINSARFRLSEPA